MIVWSDTVVSDAEKHRLLRFLASDVTHTGNYKFLFFFIPEYVQYVYYMYKIHSSVDLFEISESSPHSTSDKAAISSVKLEMSTYTKRQYTAWMITITITHKKPIRVMVFWCPQFVCGNNFMCLSLFNQCNDKAEIIRDTIQTSAILENIVNYRDTGALLPIVEMTITITRGMQGYANGTFFLTKCNA